MIQTEPLFQSLIETTTPSSLMYLPIRDITAQVKDLTVCLIHSVLCMCWILSFIYDKMSFKTFSNAQTLQRDLNSLTNEMGATSRTSGRKRRRKRSSNVIYDFFPFFLNKKPYTEMRTCPRAVYTGTDRPTKR